MYKSKLSGKVSRPGERMAKVIVKTRPKTYYKVDEKTGENKQIGQGHEIVKEIAVLPSEVDKVRKES